MWESRRDFQRVWERWEAGFLAFHAFHTLFISMACFLARATLGLQLHRPAQWAVLSQEVFVVLVVDECFGDDLLVDDARKIAVRKTGASEWIAVCPPTGWGAGV